MGAAHLAEHEGYVIDAIYMDNSTNPQAALSTCCSGGSHAGLASPRHGSARGLHHG